MINCFWDLCMCVWDYHFSLKVGQSNKGDWVSHYCELRKRGGSVNAGWNTLEAFNGLWEPLGKCPQTSASGCDCATDTQTNRPTDKQTRRCGRTDPALKKHQIVQENNCHFQRCVFTLQKLCLSTWSHIHHTTLFYRCPQPLVRRPVPGRSGTQWKMYLSSATLLHSKSLFL